MRNLLREDAMWGQAVSPPNVWLREKACEKQWTRHHRSVRRPPAADSFPARDREMRCSRRTVLYVGSMAGRSASGAAVCCRVDPTAQNCRSAMSFWNARNIGPMTGLPLGHELRRRKIAANDRRRPIKCGKAPGWPHSDSLEFRGLGLGLFSSFRKNAFQRH